MLLIDEIDRADDEFEAFLLEVLSDFQITIPEIGTIAARRRPTVILTSNRTRELHDALKRRCLFHWITHPALEREVEILRLRVPGVLRAAGGRDGGVRRRPARPRPGQGARRGRDDRLDAGARRPGLRGARRGRRRADARRRPEVLRGLRPACATTPSSRCSARRARRPRPPARERGPHPPPRHLRPRAARGRPGGRAGAHGGRAARPGPRRHHAPGRRLLDAAHDARRPARGPRALRPRLRRLVPAPRRCARRRAARSIRARCTRTPGACAATRARAARRRRPTASPTASATARTRSCATRTSRR